MISRRIFSGAVLTAPMASTLMPAAHASVAVGQAAPDFTATDTSGKARKLSEFRGKFVVLEWTNPGCPFVRKHYGGNMQATQKDATAKGAVWLAINSTEEASSDYLPPVQLASWMGEKNASPTATLMDPAGTLGQLYGAKTTPTMFIVNPQGQLVYAGAIDSIASARVDDIKTATNYVRQGLAEAMAGKPLTVAASRAYGCSVKYKA
jgi:peroxiredoxin